MKTRLIVALGLGVIFSILTTVGVGRSIVRSVRHNDLRWIDEYGKQKGNAVDVMDWTKSTVAEPECAVSAFHADSVMAYEAVSVSDSCEDAAGETRRKIETGNWDSGGRR